jgi:hypothetical protein
MDSQLRENYWVFRFENQAEASLSVFIEHGIVENVASRLTRSAPRVISSIFWDITPCSPLKVNRRFGGTFRLHLQERKVSQYRNHREGKWQAEQQAAFTFISCLA